MTASAPVSIGTATTDSTLVPLSGPMDVAPEPSTMTSSGAVSLPPLKDQGHANAIRRDTEGSHCATTKVNDSGHSGTIRGDDDERRICCREGHHTAIDEDLRTKQVHPGGNDVDLITAFTPFHQRPSIRGNGVPHRTRGAHGCDRHGELGGGDS